MIGASMSMLPFFQWCEDLAMSQAFRDSTYLFAVTQALHLLAVTVFAPGEPNGVTVPSNEYVDDS